MDERPVTRYAKAPDGVSLAYQVTGDGPLDLLFVSSLAVPVDLLWDEPSFVRFAKRLGSFSRTVLCEARGVGASGGDYLDSLVEEIADGDLTAVLDASECRRFVLVGNTNAGPTAIHYVGMHPERVSALILINTFAHYVREDDYPWGVSLETLGQATAQLNDLWGTGHRLDIFAPSKADDDAFRVWWARNQRLGVSPDQIIGNYQASCIRDVRRLLPTLVVPTLVLHRQENHFVLAGAGEYLAEHIPGAKFVGLPGADHLFFAGETDALLDEVEEFLTGTRQAPEGDVVTSTILFTDIVASTEHSARVGHRKWTALVHDHDAMVRATLARHRGHEVKTMGDGFLATFDATTRAVRAATEIVAQAKSFDLEVRAGVHNGDVEVRPDDVVGLAVTISKRICDLAGPGELLVSEAVKSHLVGSGIVTSERGTHVLKGVPEQWRLFAVGG